jgi:hypothetical protein
MFIKAFIVPARMERCVYESPRMHILVILSVFLFHIILMKMYYCHPLVVFQILTLTVNYHREKAIYIISILYIVCLVYCILCLH